MTMEEFDGAKKAKELGTDPLMEQSFGRLLLSIPKRLVTVITKMLSMKGVAFATATYLVMKQMIPAWAWLSVTVVLIFGEKALKYLKDLKG